jgi:hypothetical protein
MDRAKEAIRSYCVGKGSLGYEKYLMLWDLIDDQWNGMLHRPIDATTIALNPTCSYSCTFDFDCEVMERILGCLQITLIRTIVEPLIERWRCIGTTMNYLDLTLLSKKVRI